MRLLDFVVNNLWRRKLRTALTCLGVALAVAATLALLAFSNGLERSAAEVYEGRGIDLIVVRSGVTQQVSSSLDEGIGKTISRLASVRAVNSSQTDIVSFGEGSLVGISVHGW